MTNSSGDSNTASSVKAPSEICVTGCSLQKVSTFDHHIVRPIGRNDYQLIYIIKGCGIFTFDKPVEISEGTIVLYKPDEPQIYSYFAANQTECFWLHAKGCELEGYFNQLGIQDLKTLHIGQRGDIIELFRNIQRELQLKPSFYEKLCQGYFMELLITISRKNKHKNSKLTFSRYQSLVDVADFIHDNYNDQSTLEDYAKRCFLSKYRFIYCFKAFIGVTPIAYKNQIRVEKAKEYLENTSLSITEIAELVGFENTSYFTRFFRRSEGVSPREYKKAHQLSNILSM